MERAQSCDIVLMAVSGTFVLGFRVQGFRG